MKREQAIEIKIPLGLHLRVAIRLVELAKKFDATIMLTNTHHIQASAHCVIDLLMLEASQGDIINVCATGNDAPQALKAIHFLLSHQSSPSQQDITRDLF